MDEVNVILNELENQITILKERFAGRKRFTLGPDE